jgi:putative phosphoribosyl transferase
MRFTDACSAGLALAAKLEAYRGSEDTLVLALARGGVAVGLEVAKRLGLPLDLILIRRLLVPHGPEAPLCAVSVCGNTFVDEEVATRAEAVSDHVLEPPDRILEPSDCVLEPPDRALAYFVADALAEFARREHACRGERPPIDLARKTVLLVDNGICTGSTMRVAVRALRSRGSARIVAAVPVAAAGARACVEAVTDDLVCLASPEPFGHVGLWYASFKRPGDDEIRAMLEESEQ